MIKLISFNLPTDFIFDYDLESSKLPLEEKLKIQHENSQKAKLYNNLKYDIFCNKVNELKPDFIFLQEYDKDQTDKLLNKLIDYKIVTACRDSYGAVIIYKNCSYISFIYKCKNEIKTSANICIGKFKIFSKTYKLISLRLMPQKHRFGERLSSIKEFIAICKKNKRIICAGDMNILSDFYKGKFTDDLCNMNLSDELYKYVNDVWIELGKKESEMYTFDVKNNKHNDVIEKYCDFPRNWCKQSFRSRYDRCYVSKTIVSKRFELCFKETYESLHNNTLSDHYGIVMDLMLK